MERRDTRTFDHSVADIELMSRSDNQREACGRVESCATPRRALGLAANYCRCRREVGAIAERRTTACSTDPRTFAPFRARTTEGNPAEM